MQKSHLLICKPCRFGWFADISDIAQRKNDDIANVAKAQFQRAVHEPGRNSRLRRDFRTDESCNLKSCACVNTNKLSTRYVCT